MNKYKAIIKHIINIYLVNTVELTDSGASLGIVSNDARHLTHLPVPLTFSEFQVRYIHLESELFDFANFVKDYQIDDLKQADLNRLLSGYIYDVKTFKRLQPNYDLRKTPSFLMTLPKPETQAKLGFNLDNPIVDYKIHPYFVGDHALLHFQFFFRNGEVVFCEINAKATYLHSQFHSFSLGNKLRLLTEKEFNATVENTFNFCKEHRKDYSYFETEDESSTDFSTFESWLFAQFTGNEVIEIELSDFARIMFKCIQTSKQRDFLLGKLNEIYTSTQDFSFKTTLDNMSFYIEKCNQASYLIKVAYDSRTNL